MRATLARLRVTGMVVLALLLVSSEAWAGGVQLGDGTFNVHVRSLREQRYSRVIAQQFDFSCGAAAVATLLSYGYEVPTPEAVPMGEMFKNGDQATIQKVGFSLLDMRNYMASRGYDAAGYKADLDKVISTGLPGITLITTGTYHHFIVLRGVHDGHVLVADPARGLKVMSRADFEKAWTGVILLVRNHQNVGTRHFNDPADWRLTPSAPSSRGLDSQRRMLADIFLDLPLANQF